MHEKRKKTLLYSTMAYVCVPCIILNINLTQKENEAVKKQLRSLSFCVHAIQAVQRKKRKSCLKMNFGNSNRAAYEQYQCEILKGEKN